MTWITDRDPPPFATYLISTRTIDGAPFIRTAYYSRDAWADLPHYQPVDGWMDAPLPLMAGQVARELELTRVELLRTALASTAHQPAECSHCQALIRGAYQALFRDDRVARGEC